MRIIVSGGGTGGHIYPAITIIRTLQKKISNLEVLYVGTSAGLEADIVPREGIEFKVIDLQNFKRSLSIDNLFRAAKAIAKVWSARTVVKEFKPDVVIGTGGYVCGPILMAAALMGIPTLVQEQNVFPGITNKILSRFVSCVATGSPEAVKYFPAEKTVFTGNPIRSEVMKAKPADGYKEFGLSPEKKTVLVSGGSRGARSINLAMVDVFKKYMDRDDVQIIHVTGKNEYDDAVNRAREAGIDLNVHKHLQIRPYLYNMPQAMAITDVAIFRAGATGLAELMARGIPSILIPYPYAAENHQEYNARAVEKAEAARVILNKELADSTILTDTLENMLSNPRKLRKMAAASKLLGRPQAADDIAAIVMKLAGENK